MNNNVALFTLGSFFLILAFLSPFIGSYFGGSGTSFDTDQFDSNINDLEIQTPTDILTSAPNFVTIIISLFFWVIGVPAWLNMIILMLRVLFWIIVYDKIRGIGS